MSTPRKGYRGLGMEGAIARWYAKSTGRDLGRFQASARAVLAQTTPTARILEVAPGPGYLAIEVARTGRQVTSLDISESFVRIARANAAAAGVVVDFQHGNASAMPFADAAFDFIVCEAAFKNFADPIGALNEMHRVLAPGGHALIHDLRKDVTGAEIDREVQTMRLPAASAWMTRWVFRSVLRKRAYTRAALEQMVHASRFGHCDTVDVGIGLELRFAKAS
jgi:ubiquinone/menaquinone biosynthesis C-methylase UbiE